MRKKTQCAIRKHKVEKQNKKVLSSVRHDKTVPRHCKNSVWCAKTSLKLDKSVLDEAESVQKQGKTV